MEDRNQKQKSKTEVKSFLPKSIRQIRQAFIFLFLLGIILSALFLYSLFAVGEGYSTALLIILVIVLSFAVLTFLAFIYLPKPKKSSYVIGWVALALNFIYILYFTQSYSVINVIPVLGMLYLTYCLSVVRGYFIGTEKTQDSFRFSPLIVLVLSIVLSIVVGYLLFFLIPPLT
jgi:hypothetical protein